MPYSTPLHNGLLADKWLVPLDFVADAISAVTTAMLIVYSISGETVLSPAGTVIFVINIVVALQRYLLRDVWSAYKNLATLGEAPSSPSVQC